MYISYRWLKDLVEVDLPLEEMARRLTGAGLAVEGIHAAGDDFVFDFDLTSNRSDCLSHLGIARETATVVPGAKLRDRESSIDEGRSTGPEQNLVSIEDPELCHRFTARIIRNVRIGPSPEWLVKRLEAVGERSINNVADITNYVMHELGQPMHSFDLKKLRENRIVVRRARAGETIRTLDEVERKLDETMLAICDAEGPVAVAGVMGGFESGISDQTTDVLLEVAYFKRESIRQTSRRLNLSTEASYRFERGVDIENLVRASNRAAQLICELAGGEDGEFADVYPTKVSAREIESPDLQFAVKRLTGLDIDESEILRILSALGIESRAGAEGSRVFTAPTWRHDIAIEEDLVEEVARVYGYDKIAEELPPAFGAGEYQPGEMRKSHLRRTLAGLGFDEAISYSFIDTKNDDRFELVPGLLEEGLDEKFVTLRDSIIEGAVRMRPTLLAGLLDAVRTNFNHQRRDLRLFEVGKVFAAARGESDLPTERELFSLVVTGSETLQNKAMPVREFDFYDAKGALEAALDAVNAPRVTFAAKDVRHLRKGQSAEVRLGDEPVGTLGRLSDEIAAAYKFRQPVFVAEIDLQKILAADRPDVLYRPLPVYPSIERDVSLLARRSLTFAEITSVVESLGFELLRRVEFVDVYEGKGVPEGERSVTIRFVYRSDERTLTEEEVEAIHKQILENIEARLNVRQRL